MLGFETLSEQPLSTLPLSAALELSADAGSFTYTGQAASLAKSWGALDAATGIFTYTGQPATLQYALLYPNPADVLEGTIYGPGGIYVGTMKGFITQPLYLFDD